MDQTIVVKYEPEGKEVVLSKPCCSESAPYFVFRVICGRLFCKRCGHEKCILCDKGVNTWFYDRQDWDMKTDYYFSGWENHVIHRAVPMKELLEDGPTLEELEAVPEFFRFKTLLSEELKTMVLAYAFIPPPRTIRAFYCRRKKTWSYRADADEVDHVETENKVPYVLHGFGGHTRPLAQHLFEPAPKLDFHPYPYFNYKIDTLWLDIQHCGTRYCDSSIYMEGLESGIQLLIQNRVENPEAPVLTTLKVSYCTMVENPAEFLGQVGEVTGIETLILDVHNHYAPDHKDKYLKHRSKDYLKLKQQWDANAFKSYVFNVQIRLDGRQIRPRIPPEDRIGSVEDIDSEEEYAYEDSDSESDIYDDNGIENDDSDWLSDDYRDAEEAEENDE